MRIGRTIEPMRCAGQAANRAELGTWQRYRWLGRAIGANSAPARYKVPSENIVYADRAGNIGWIAAGLAPIRKNWSGLFPVPGDSGEYEWDGYLSIDEMPQTFNPARHFIATANNNILPEGYTKQLSYEWAVPARYQRIVDMLSSHRNIDVRDFELMQQ